VFAHFAMAIASLKLTAQSCSNAINGQPSQNQAVSFIIQDVAEPALHFDWRSANL
jgi:hypothetical protein